MKHEFARTLRRNQTDLERKLWYALRGRQFHAHKFRRQQPIGPYIADFVCFERRLVIELDGSQHARPENISADRTRTAFLESQGFRVLRVWNLDFIRNRDGVLWSIHLAVEENPSPGASRHPLPQGERGLEVGSGIDVEGTPPSSIRGKGVWKLTAVLVSKALRPLPSVGEGGERSEPGEGGQQITAPGAEIRCAEIDRAFDQRVLS